VHALVPAVIVGMTRLTALEGNAEAEPAVLLRRPGRLGSDSMAW